MGFRIYRILGYCISRCVALVGDNEYACTEVGTDLLPPLRCRASKVIDSAKLDLWLKWESGEVGK